MAAVQIFVSEYLCSGAWTGSDIPASLAAEGQAMLLAFLDDLSKIDNCKIVTTWDTRLSDWTISNVTAFPINDPADEKTLFRKLAAESDITFVIAPEFDGILAQRARWVQEVGGNWAGCSCDAIELCADKLLFYQHCLKHDIPTIETHLLEGKIDLSKCEFPFVLKPRFGVGCEHTFVVQNQSDFEMIQSEFSSALNRQEMILQPFIPGQAASVAVLVSHENIRFEITPVAAQYFSSTAPLKYLGGKVPIPVSNRQSDAIHSVAFQMIESLPGLNAYCGIDLILPEDDTADPVIVELNPRLTSSYLGYRNICKQNLAERIIFPETQPGSCTWKNIETDFTV